MAWNCLPTCIGSLPNKNTAEAVDLILQNLRSIPFWPQLPQIGFKENMYIQFAQFLPGVQIDENRKKISVDLSRYDPEEFYTRVLSDDLNSFSYPREGFAGFHDFLSRKLPSTVVAVKGQITGPVSMGLQINDQNGKPVIYDETYAEIIRKNQNMMARWQERRMLEMGRRVITFVDEPYLSLVGTPFASVSSADVVKWLDEVMEGIQGIKGVHCCANTDWSMVLSTKADLLSFDAHDYGHTLSLYPDEVERFLNRGGIIAWGIVPNSEQALQATTVGGLVEKLEHRFDLLARKGINKERIISHSIVTPQCGMGGVSVPTSEAALRTLVAVSEGLRKRFGLEGKQ